MSESKQNNQRRSGIAIMGRLIGLVAPLWHIMLLAIILGTCGYLCAIFITILAGAVLTGSEETRALHLGFMLGFAVLRGVLHYAEQYCNHFIAFKLLAIIRHKVFAALRKLCPAKLEGRDKGNLISIITTDIELLEVFYAHTISPIMIAILTSTIMVVFIGKYHVLAGVLAAAAYLIVGVLIPMWNGKKGAASGMEFREGFGQLNSTVLDSLRGLDETIQYQQGEQQKEKIQEESRNLSKLSKKLSQLESGQRSATNLVILISSIAMLFLSVWLVNAGQMPSSGVIICTIAMMGSFGPVVALSNLSNNLSQTLASGERVLSLLEEQPIVEEAAGDIQEKDLELSKGIHADHVTFAYEDEVILKDYSIDIKKGSIVGIHGASGSGKSTLLKLMMRFWNADEGSIQIGGKDVNEIPTNTLRDMEGYMTQESYLFHDSIAANIAIGKQNATREEIIEAAKKASIHEFIESLPDGYDTKVGELGSTLSGGERQRIGIARLFLHDAPIFLLDEPTSNLDSLNEGVILKSIKEFSRDKTVVIVSHRKSTFHIADSIVEMDNQRVS